MMLDVDRMQQILSGVACSDYERFCLQVYELAAHADFGEIDVVVLIDDMRQAPTIFRDILPVMHRIGMRPILRSLTTFCIDATTYHIFAVAAPTQYDVGVVDMRRYYHHEETKCDHSAQGEDDIAQAGH
jgi:hypothetical protein